MEKIKLEFSAQHILMATGRKVVVMTLDETGKNYTVKNENLYEFAKNLSENQDDLPSLPKRVLTAFTEDAINKILSKDEIPRESDIEVLDGDSYTITITKGDMSKEYHADDASIETYPLLRYLASWCRSR